MSHWTYVKGVISISAVGRTQEEMRYIAATVLSHLPKVTGSERNMSVRLIQRDGYDTFCSRNERGVYIEDGVELQSTYDIILAGELRDRTFHETLFELTKFLCRLSKRLIVEDILVSVSGDYYSDKKYIFSDKGPFSEMYEFPSWSLKSKDKSSCWWEYLYYDDREDDDE